MIRDEKKVETTLKGIESKTFTVEDSDKVFGIMFESLYKHVQQSIIRELWSNAWDAHKEAGNEDMPFFCQLPTPIDPTFKVRDYGVGMSHEKIMYGYSNALESDKDQTNELVGAIGIGSKSPLAYANSYTMLAYSGETVRTYVIALNEDHIPTIHYLGEAESNEPRGIEVTFGVVASDCSAFEAAATRVALGFPVKPITPGKEYKDPTPLFEADGLKIFKTEVFPSNNYRTYEVQAYVKMGTVLYPYDTDNEQLRSLFAHHQTIVIEVPIGSVHFTPSREELRMTDKTRGYLNQVVANITESFEQLITDEFNQADSRIDQYKSLIKWDGVLRREVISKMITKLGVDDSFDLHAIRVNNLPPELKIASAKGFEPVSLFNKVKSPRGLSFPWNTLLKNKIMFVIDNNPKRTVRAYRRAMLYAQEQGINPTGYGEGSLYYLKNPRNSDVERLVRLLGLGPDRIVNINAIPDPGAEKRATGPDPDSLRGAHYTDANHRDNEYWSVTDSVKEMPAKYYWVHIDGLTRRSIIPFKAIPNYRGYHHHFKQKYESTVPRLMSHLLKLNGDPMDTRLYVLGVKAMEKLNPDEEYELSAVVKRALEQHKDDFQKLINHRPVNSIYHNRVVEEILAQSSDTIASVDPAVKEVFDTAHSSRIMELFRALYVQDDSDNRSDDLLETKYPLLFTKTPSKEQVQEYIDFINNKEKVQ